MTRSRDPEQEALNTRWKFAEGGSVESEAVLNTDTEQRMKIREPLVSTYTEKDQEGPTSRVVAYSRTRESGSSEWSNWRPSFD